MTAGTPVLLTEIASLDELLHDHAAVLGGDFTAYRNHSYRVVNLCVALSSGAPEQIEKMAIAAAFHDLGIWTDGTFDYLQPSIRLASAHLHAPGKCTRSHGNAFRTFKIDLVHSKDLSAPFLHHRFNGHVDRLHIIQEIDS